jgi:MraZ protein
MFIGEYNHTMDGKGRVTMPVKFREELGEIFYVTKGFDECLFVYTEDEWEKFRFKLESNKLTKKDARRIQRFFIASANECNLDKQGRVLVSSPLREYASIKKDVVIIGVSNRVEIWSKEKWTTYNLDDEFDISELAEDMEELDL